MLRQVPRHAPSQVLEPSPLVGEHKDYTSFQKSEKKIKELCDTKSLTSPSRCFKSLPAAVARKRKSLAEGERNYENQSILRNFTDTGVGRRKLCADAGQSQTRPVF